MAAVGTLGRVDEFDGTKDDWLEYVERLEYFFAANGIADADKKRAVLLTVIGAATYKTLRNIVSPMKPGEKSYVELVEALTKHFKPTPSEIVERFKFHSRVRKPGESIATYVAELRSLTEYCNFGATLDVMIRDRLVCGVNDRALQKQLLAQTDLTYEKAVELALNAEIAAQSMRELGGRPESAPSELRSPQEVHKTSTSGASPAGPPSKSPLICYRCGLKGHAASKCRVDKSIVCHYCHKRGHMQRACKSKPKLTSTKTPLKSKSVSQILDDEREEQGEEQVADTILKMSKSRQGSDTPPILVKIKLDGCVIDMEVDTGASLSLMPESTFSTLWPGRSLQPSSTRLQTYLKETIPVVGCTCVNVDYNGQMCELPLVVVGGSGPSLLGRDWLSQIQLDWRQINQVHNASLVSVLARYPGVFKEGLGTLKGFKAKIYVDPDTPPRFSPARSVPFALRDKVNEELQRLQEEGTIEPVEFAEWAAPIVAVLKRDRNSVRICGDFSVTVNPVSKLDRYPIPKVEDLLARLSKGKHFSKLDLSQAYQQLPLEEDSKKYVVINTHRGLFRYTRLPFGISSAPAIFQRVIESILQGIEGVIVYLDDILITGKTTEAHLKALDEVLSRLDTAGLRVKRSKCEFMKPSVTYLGHRIDVDGLHPLPDRVTAIREAPAPKSVSQLKSYLGMLTYYSKFLPNLSTLLHPLYQLLKKDVEWTWGVAQAKAFTVSKDLLVSKKCLTHFDSTLDLTLACDASAYGLGAVLSHKMADGTERPIAYSSRTLTPSERNYSQLEKEGLACIFGIKKFHNYVFGRSFELVTDHKPLLGLLKEYRPTSQQASSRIKRWSLFLSNYEYRLVFRNTSAHANADALSRLPLPEQPVKVFEEPELVLLAEHLDESPVTANDIRVWTQRDQKLARVLQYIQQGWPTEGDPELEPYSSRRLELSSYQGCIMWGTRIVIPPRGREAVLQELHEAHPGITRMKSLARMYVWWPGISADIEKSVRLCNDCQQVQSLPPLAPLHPWRWPTRPWARIHLDFAGPFQSKNILIVVDAHSKWIEAVSTPSMSSSCVIEELRSLFARFGLPETVVTDNGTCFVSSDFEQFLKINGIRHLTSAPYHPASNGLAERAVQTVKRGLKKVKDGTMSSRLAKVLLSYRVTPQSTTGLAPAELLFGRRPRTRLDLLKPHTAERVEHKQQQQKEQHDARGKSRTFRINDFVFLKNFPGPGWLPGKIVETSGPVSFHVLLEDGRRKRCHQDQLRFRVVDDGPPEMSEIPLTPITSKPTSQTEPDEPELSNSDQPQVQIPTTASTSSETTDTSDRSDSNIRRYPRRQRKPRERFEPGMN